MSLENITVPDVGGEEVEVIEILVSVGDEVAEEDGIITVESDKASMDIPVPMNGKIAELKISVGDKIKEGDLICTLEAGESSTEEEPKETQAEEIKEEPKEEVVEEEVSESQEESDEVEVSEEETTITVPDVGGEKVEVIDIIVNVGDEVAEEDGIITVESEKASMDIPAPSAGTIGELKISIGDKIGEGDVICTFISKSTKTVAKKASKPETKTPTKQEPKKEAPKAKESSEDSSAVINKNPDRIIYASPSVRRYARSFGVDLSQVNGTGRKERILEEDVKKYIKLVMTGKVSNAAASGGGVDFGFPPLKEIDFSEFGEIETEELSKIKKLSGANLHRNWVNIPHVTQHDEADITDLNVFVKKQREVAAKRGYDFKVTLLSFIIKAVAFTLKQHPTMNASLTPDKQSLVLKKYVHIGVAVDTKDGLVVPVVKDADKKGIIEISKELAEISNKARDGKLTPADMKGASFTISSLGGIGGKYFTPIINAPEVGILGVSRTETKPRYIDGELAPRDVIPLSLSYDHRVIDGAEGARFITTLSNALADIKEVLL